VIPADLSDAMTAIDSQTRPKLRRLLESPALPWLLIALGFALRLRRYLQIRGVMHSEAQLSYNILTKSFWQLLKPLDIGDQAAPVGFLMLQKTSTVFLGGGEYAIRLVPFLAAVIALPIFWNLIRKILPGPAAQWGLGWFVLCEQLLRYGAEGKQYSSDVLCTLIVLSLALRANNRAGIILLAIVGTILIWFSHPILFVLGGVGIALVFDHLRDRNWRLLCDDFIAGFCWIGSFALNFLLITRYYASSQYLTDYWANQHAFAPIPRSLATLLWYPKAVATAFTFPVAIAPGDKPMFSWISWLAAGLFPIGCVILFVRQRRMLIALATALLFCAIASGLHKYPFGERLLLFSTPLWILPLAAAVGAIPEKPRWILIPILFVYPVYLQAKYAIHPPLLYDVKPPMAYVKSHWQTGDTLYLPWGSDVLARYYLDTQPEYAIPDAHPISGVWQENPSLQQKSYADDLSQLNGKSRVWIVFSMDGKSEQPMFESILNQRGRIVEQYCGAGGSADLYDLR
jgi:hypothetical protein